MFSGLKDQLAHCPVLLNAQGTNIQTIVGEELFLITPRLNFIIYYFFSDEVMNTEEAAHLDERQKAMVKDLFSQGVKHKMRVNLVRQISKTSSSAKFE